MNLADPILHAATRLVESGRIPDPLVRAGIRYNIRGRLRELAGTDAAAATTAFLHDMDAAPIALVPDRANAQHYELPPEFFGQVLGPRRKYSCCLWAPGTTTLAAAEDAALRQVVERAGIADGMQILELGCGWGSLTLWLAEHFPNARITAVSNAAAQARYIQGVCRERGHAGVTVLTADMNHFATTGRFDRVVSVEMFEHLRNWRQMLARITGWLTPEGALFLHVFSHVSIPYPYIERDAGDWMTRYFFTGGMMPSHGLVTRVLGTLALWQDWRLDGTHYEKTANAWLENMDHNPEPVNALLARTYGADADRWRMRWRIFFMACAELFGSNAGGTWGISHALIGRDRC